MSKVKICGLVRTEDAGAANYAMPDYAGFVFAPGRRQIDAAAACRLRDKLDPRIISVGVFVNKSIESVVEIYKNMIIGIVQLHGDEDAGYIAKLKDACGCLVIKAVGVGGEGWTAPSRRRNAGDKTAPWVSEGAVAAQSCNTAPSRVSTASPPSAPDYLLFDAVSAWRGGAGVKFDWNVLAGYRGPPYFLAGGLTCENVGAAVSLLNPYCVDASSGVETGGYKDAAKIMEFVGIVRRTPGGEYIRKDNQL